MKLKQYFRDPRLKKQTNKTSLGHHAPGVPSEDQGFNICNVPPPFPQIMVDMLKLINEFNCRNSPRDLHHLPTFHYYPPYPAYGCTRRGQRGVRVWSLRSNAKNLKIEQSQRLMRAKVDIAREQSELKEIYVWSILSNYSIQSYYCF